MRFSTTAKSAMLDALDESQTVGAKYGSLHSAYSATGANELAGGGPAYARKAAAWAAAASGSKAMTGTLVFDVPAGQTVRWLGLWDAVTAGTFLGMTPNGGTVPQAFVVPDSTNDTLECAAHGFSVNDAVVVWAGSGDPLPAPLVEGTVYWVAARTTDDLTLATTSGGPVLDLLAVGAGLLQRIVPEVFGAQGTHTITSCTLSLD
ncbi:MAG TPA: hypothetical protein VIL10_05325 [Marmoricola sp.]|jgi:hypothetical protein